MDAAGQELFRAQFAQNIALISDLIERVQEKERQGVELFIRPAKLAARIYNRALVQKIAAILGPEMQSIQGLTTSPRLTGPVPL